MKTLLLTLSLFLIPSAAFGVDKVIKAPSGKVILGTQANVRASEGAGTTTLTVADAREQIFNLSAARTVKLPSTGVKAGDKWTFKNVAAGNYALTVQPSGSATTLAVVNSKYAIAESTALINTPTAAADWQTTFKYDGQVYYCDISGGPNDISYNGGVKSTMSASPATLNDVPICYFIPYQTIDGIWWIKGSMVYNLTTNVTDATIAINGITHLTAGRLAVAGSELSADRVLFGQSTYQTNNFIIRSSSGTGFRWTMAIDVPLSGRPTWAY